MPVGNDGPEGVKDWMRSDEVEYIEMVMQEHCAHRVLSELGMLGAMQFSDLNHDLTLFQRAYVREVQRCDAIERKLKFFEEQMVKYKVEPGTVTDVDQILGQVADRQKERGRNNYMNTFEAIIDEKEKELLELNRYNATLSAERAVQEELEAILLSASEYATDNQSNATASAQSAQVGGDVESGTSPTQQGEDSLRFRFVSGVCNSLEFDRFKRMVFRSTRGNCLTWNKSTNKPLTDAATGEAVNKTVFIIFFQSKLIQDKIQRIADAFGARLHQIPDLSDYAAIQACHEEVERDLMDRDNVLEKNRSDIESLLSYVARFHDAAKWIVMREKAIYHSMNHFNTDVRGVLRAEGWVVTAKKNQVIETVRNVHADMLGGSSTQQSLCSVNDVPKTKWPSMPPTYFKLNNFTRVYQIIVDTYGTPRYQEANPALMTVVTFPFAFGVMFGDIGHGLLLLAFAAYVVYNEKMFEKMKNSNELVAIIYGGRYMLVLMGFFATYCGFIYNDFFAIGLLIWPTAWDGEYDGPLTINFSPNENGVYPLGVDPTWHRASNDLLFFNSLKMKMSVVFGVTQMVVGLIHRLQNALYFNKYKIWGNLDLWFEAIPMLVFMISLFGYMCALIILKWSRQWVWDDCVEVFEDGVLIGTTAPGCDRNNCCNPPALITQLINIALNPGVVSTAEEIYEGQGDVQGILILVAVCMLPLLLIPKPYFLIRRMKAAHARVPTSENGDADTDLMLGDDSNGHGAEEHHEEEEGHGAGDIIIHQAIETIEFTLGCISNTASYLRLWALSLAHSQLASVFLEKALLDYIGGEGALGPIMVFGGYGIFAAITFAVLLCMDNLECFLHALRLHWVEYQSKFFYGDGIPFTPLSFHHVRDT